MSSMSGLPPLTWGHLATTWRLAPGWLVVCAVLAAAYVVLRRRADQPVPAWRASSFLTGTVLLWVCVASGLEAYAMDVFWVHMVLHLLLVMVVPVLLVLGHPITVLVDGLAPRPRSRVESVLRSRPLRVLAHPLVGLAVYAVVIVGTHLTGFMDQMALHPSLGTVEQVLYVVAGYWFLMPLLGDEPVGGETAYLLRLLLLIVGMVPDTLVGIVLMQATSDPFPVMMSHHPSWAPPTMTDVYTAGGLMWAGGDGLMMVFAVGLVIAVITSPTRREAMTGRWLDSVRSSVVAGGSGGSGAQVDPDSDEAFAAYNQMLQRRHGSAPSVTGEQR